MARILFVDDDPYTLETLTKAVELFGHQAVLAGSGEEALRLLTGEMPDLIFIDLMLPDIGGLQVLKQLKNSPGGEQVPMYMLSAATERDMGEQTVDVGAVAYLSKPIRLQTLLDIIQKHFE